MQADDGSQTPTPEVSPEQETPSHPIQDLGHELLDAAIEAEYQTGGHEESEEQARRHVAIRIARMIGGFVVIGIGIAGRDHQLGRWPLGQIGPRLVSWCAGQPVPDSVGHSVSWTIPVGHVVFNQVTPVRVEPVR